MKLRNKKTGEILEGLGSFILQNPKRLNCEAITKYDSLSELTEEWEDYKEPKGYWYIRDGGNIDYNLYGESIINRHKEIGNYFETEEEAEKAVEKLKAWKQLKNKGFKFKAWSIPEKPETSHITIKIWAQTEAPDSPHELDLLFGGEE